MANIAWGKVECYVSIEAKCWMFYFMYSTWQGNDLSVIKKNFLHYTYTNCGEYVDTSRQIQMNSLILTFTILCIAVPAEENQLKSFWFFAIHVSGSILL